MSKQQNKVEAYQKSLNKKSKKMKVFNKATAREKFEKDLEEKDFYDQYRIIFVIGYMLAIACQIASGVSSYEYFAGILAYKLPLASLDPINGTAILAMVLLVCVEVIKFYFYTITLRLVFARERKYEPTLLIATGLISVFSAYATILGASELGTDTQLPISIQQKADSTLQNLEQETKLSIAQKESRIKEIEKSSQFQKTVWIGNGQTKQELTPQGLNLIAKERADIDRLQNKLDQKEQTLSSRRELELKQASLKNQRNASAYRWTFGTFEFLFIIAQLFIWHFKRQTILNEEVPEIEEVYHTEKDKENENPQTILQTLFSNLQEFANSKQTKEPAGFKLPAKSTNLINKPSTNSPNSTNPENTNKLTSNSDKSEEPKKQTQSL